MFCSEWAAVLGCGCSWLQAWFCRARYGAHGPRRARSFLVPTSDTPCAEVPSFLLQQERSRSVSLLPEGQPWAAVASEGRLRPVKFLQDLWWLWE